MSEPIRVVKNFGDGGDRLLLNPAGSLVGVFTYERKASNRHTLAVYAAADGRCVGGPLALGDSRGASFLNDDTLLIAHEQELLRWRVGGEPEQVMSSPDFLYALGVCPARDLVALVFEARSQGVMGWQIAPVALRTGEQLWTGAAPFSLWVNAVGFSPGGRFVVAELGETKGEERALLLCDTATGRRVQTFYGTSGIWGAAFAPDEESFVAFPPESKDGLNVYELNRADPVRMIPLPQQFKYPTAAHFAPDGSWLDVIDHTGARVRLDPTSGRVLETHSPPVKLAHYSGIVISASGNVAAGVAEDNTVVVWPLDDGGSGERRREPRVW